MNGLKIKIAIVCAIAAAALAMLFFQQQTVKQLRLENESLKAQVAQATQEQQARAAQDAVNADGAATAEQQTRELARLRNQVAQLRKSTNDLAKSTQAMQTRNQRLESEAEASKNAAVQAHAESQRIQNMDTCVNFLRIIDSAKQQWALENKMTATNVPTLKDIAPYLPLTPNGNMPTCPDGGTYTIGAVNEKPTCSVPGHVLQ